MYEEQVSIFVDAISSAIGPAIIEATTGTDSVKKSAGVAGGKAAVAAAFQPTGATTARDRNNRRRRNGDLAVESIRTYTRGLPQREGEKNLQRPPFGDPRDGVSKNGLAACCSAGNGGDRDCAGDCGNGIMNEETVLGNGVALAEARRKMLEPPNVGSLAPCI